MKSGIRACVCALALTHAFAAVPLGWTRRMRAAPTQQIELVIGITQPAAGKAALEEALWAVSDPSRASYGQHLTHTQVDALVAPKREDVEAVEAWLLKGGARGLTYNRNQDMVRAHMSVAQAEALLSTQYYLYTHESAPSSPILRCESVALPPPIDRILDFVGPTTRFPARMAGMKARAVAAPNDGVDPSYIRTQYNIGAVESKTASNRQQAAGFLGQFISQDDLQTFFAQFYPVAKGRKPAIVGPNDQTNPGLEASLDIQYITSIGGNVNSTYWYTDGQRPYGNEPFLVWLQNITSLPASSIPYVISVSYGDNEDTVDYDYASRVNVEFQKLGAQGTSIMYSSGDGGVAGSQPTQCTQFIPTFPAGSPYVTSVGATENSSPQVAASFSSGGFANYWPQPSYQTQAVSQYFKVAQHLPPSNVYNRTGRGFPDVSAFGTSFNIVVGGGVMQVDGTSCSAPTFAGVVSLLNDLRLQAGKSTLGFLNPLLYANAALFTDVTQGNNPGCSTNGFFAAVGWDPITGLGTPDYKKLAQLVLSLP